MCEINGMYNCWTDYRDVYCFMNNKSHMHDEVAILKMCTWNIFNLNTFTKLHADFLLEVMSFKKASAFTNQDSSGL
jgi:hypothetical protein